MPVISTNSTSSYFLSNTDPFYVLSTGSLTNAGGTVSTLSSSGCSFSVLGFVDVNRFETGYDSWVRIGVGGTVITHANQGLNVGYVATNAAASAGGNTVLIAGALYSDLTGATIWGNNNSVSVSGTVISGLETFHFRGVFQNTLNNSGDITSRTGAAVVSDSTLVLSNTGTITAGASGAISANGQSLIQNDGTITSRLSSVLLSNGDDSVVTNTGHMASQSTALDLTGTYITVTNGGQIDAVQRALLLEGDHAIVTNTGTITSFSGLGVTGINEQVINAGTISATNSAISVDGGANRVTNTGRLQSMDGAGIFLTGSDGSESIAVTSGLINANTGVTITGSISARVENTGSIHGVATGIDMVSSGTLHLINHGSLSGRDSAVLVEAGRMDFENFGTVSGDVMGGSEADTFTNNGGRVQGVIGLGDGSDIYHVDRIDLALVEGAGVLNDVDTVYSLVNWTLGANFEVLTLVGTADLRGTGNLQANRITGNSGDNRINGMAGNDNISGREGDDTLTGGAGLDTLNGEDGDDRLLGGAGIDALLGGDGADTLIGGISRDVLTGGLDADLFVFAAGDTGLTVATADFINDFSIGLDRIDLSAIDAKSATLANEAFVFVTGAFTAAGQVHVVSNAGVTYVEYEVNGDALADGLIRLSAPATLTAFDFVL